jgi:hypothetical protein
MIITDSHDAAHSFRVELYDSDPKLLATEQGLFGKVYDRPFKQAFVIPEWATDTHHRSSVCWNLVSRCHLETDGKM